jgi:hypothetical protein
MKKLTPFALVLMAGLLAPRLAQAQGTLYVSNLGQTPAGTASIGSDAWIAQAFYTGANSSGYSLNAIQLLMDAGSGSPDGFDVSLYSDSGGVPGNDLGSLAGSDPAAGGLFTYTSAGLPLASQTLYFIVATAATPVAQGAYDWSYVYTSAGNNQWEIYPLSGSSSDGSSWTMQGRAETFQMGIYAAEAPEPSTLALAGLGLACLVFWRRGSLVRLPKPLPVRGPNIHANVRAMSR